MSMNLKRRIPTSEEIMEEIQVPKYLKDIKEKKGKEIRNIFENKDNRFLLIIGICSVEVLI